jgi:hypothetical protein
VPAVGFGDIAQGDMEMKYDLGTEGDKSVRFVEDGLSVVIRHPEPFEEHIPLMVAPEDHIAVDKGQVTLTRGNAVLIIGFDEEATAALVPKKHTVRQYRMHMLTLAASGTLTYTMKTLSR